MESKTLEEVLKACGAAAGFGGAMCAIGTYFYSGGEGFNATKDSMRLAVYSCVLMTALVTLGSVFTPAKRDE